MATAIDEFFLGWDTFGHLVCPSFLCVIRDFTLGERRSEPNDVKRIFSPILKIKYFIKIFDF